MPKLTKSHCKVTSAQLQEAYNRTLKGTELRGSASFCCGPGDNGASYVSCQECPLNKTDCGEKHDAKYWRQWWKELTGEKDNNEDNDTDLPKKSNIDNTANFNKELKEKAKAKYEVEYTALDSDEPRKEYVRKVVDLLSIIKEWNKEAIKWNLIANGNTSKIPFNFKDIYIKVYDPEEGVIIFQDECTLKSEGLKLAWTRDD